MLCVLLGLLYVDIGYMFAHKRLLLTMYTAAVGGTFSAGVNTLGSSIPLSGLGSLESTASLQELNLQQLRRT